MPQKCYRPSTSSDRRRYVGEVNLEPSITFFMQEPDEAGIPLGDAMHGRFARLVSRDERMFQERGPSVSVRINVSLAPHSFAMSLALTMYKPSGLDINPGAARYPQEISVTPLDLSHARNWQRTLPSLLLVSSPYASF